MKNDFQIIIPMTGSGSRFAAAGYKTLKPLIPVLGKPMIEWIVKGIFASEKDILFICRDTHLQSIAGMEELLRRICPTGRIFAVKDWEKKGPIFNILRAAQEIDDARPAVVSYCDYYMTWDLQKFKHDVTARGCAGAVPCYSGFHPHLLPLKNLYACCRVDENERLLEIREKHSFTADKTLSRHSPGVYYFKDGATLKTYGQKLIDKNLHLNGEYYASLPFQLMAEDGLDVWAPVNVERFCQWGTPEDLEEFLFWIETIKGWKA